MENPPLVAQIICIVAAALLIGLELWSAIGAQLESPAGASRARVAQREAVNTEQITAANLFGQAANQNTNLPETNLQVTLRAVFAASDPQAASAVIESSDGRTQVVKVGGAVDPSATLQAVHANRIVLMRNGELETLYFPAPQESSAMSMAGTGAPIGASTADPNLPSGTSAEEIKRAAILQRLEELRARTRADM